MMKHCICTWVSRLVSAALATTSALALAATFVPPNNPNIQYMGHWDRQPTVSTTNNSGSSILFGFTGRNLTGVFSPSALTAQHRNEIYVSIDDRTPTRIILDATAEVDFTPTPL